MYPATPTPLAAAPVAPVVLNAAQWRIWQFTDEAIMLWNQSNRWHVGHVFQIAAILIIVIFFAWYVVSQTRNLTQENDL